MYMHCVIIALTVSMFSHWYVTISLNPGLLGCCDANGLLFIIDLKEDSQIMQLSFQKLFEQNEKKNGI